MLIYLDNCCFNRPFDDQKQVRIYLETEAKLYIQDQIVLGYLQLAWSYILDYENMANPFQERRDTIARWKTKAVVDTNETADLLVIADKLYQTGIKSKDSLHIACSAIMKCDYFITTDLFLLRKLSNFEHVKVTGPIDFLNVITK